MKDTDLIGKTFPLIIFFFQIFFAKTNCDSSHWIYLSDFDTIYDEIGLGNRQSSTYILDQSDYCSIKAPSYGQSDAVFRVVCPNERKCQISSYNPPNNVINIAENSDNILASQLIKNCTYPDGKQLFRNNTSRWDRLESTVTELVLSSINLMRLPENYFCQLPNLTSVDLSGNNLTDYRQLGVPTDCKIVTKCCGCQLKELVLNKNHFETIEDDSFCGLSILVVLRLAKCGIQELKHFAFRGLDNLEYIDLSSNNLTSLPKQVFTSNLELRILFLSNNRLNNASLVSLAPLRNLRQLHLDKNRIEAIENNVLQSLINLKVLHLRDNRLTRLESNQFKRLIRLYELDVSFNLISEIDENAFNGMSDLTTLDLIENSLGEIAPGVFNGCVNLTTLKLSNNKLAEVPSDISTLLSLKNLYMDRNNISSLNSSNFAGATNLVNLDLSVNRLKALTSGLFVTLKSLKTLKLNGNQLTDVNSCFVNVSVVSLYLSDNRLTSFSFADFSPNIKFLYVSNNDIVDFNATDFRDQLNLVHLDLSCNNLTRLTRIKLPNTLQFLNLRKNQLQSISYDNDFLKGLENSLVKLQSVYLQKNQFETICRSTLPNLKVQNYFAGNPLQCSCENAWLNYPKSQKAVIGDFASLRCTPTLQRPGTSVSSKPLASVDQDDFLCPSRSDNQQCQCESNQNCSIICPDKCRCYSNGKSIPKLYIDCSQSNLSMIPYSSVNYEKMSMSIILYLEGNDFPAISGSNFSMYTNVIKLYLNNSNIYTIDVDTFNDFTKIETLHLNNNKLRTLPEGVFDNLQHLKKLYLQSNFIKQLPNNIFLPLKHLTKLAISHNNLTDYNSLLYLNNISTIDDVELSGNNWNCNCSYLKKLNSFLQNISKISQVDRVYCKFSNGTYANQPITKYYFQNCEKIIAVDNTITYIWASLLGIFVCITLIAVIIFYFRHEMQVLFYSHYGVRIFNRSKSRTAEEEGKIYDAFIAYNSEDENFLVYSLLPGLEQIDKPYRLCLHQRDFAPGAFITDSILEAVERSSRTIILLTESFVRSEWCKFEFKTAHVQMLHDRCARVIVVVVGDIPPNLDPEMNLYLKTNTYLKWGEKLFWEKLYFALPEQGLANDRIEMTNKY
ncbi:TOLL-like receptor [Chamberlinius hualienensis]